MIHIHTLVLSLRSGGLQNKSTGKNEENRGTIARTYQESLSERKGGEGDSVRVSRAIQNFVLGRLLSVLTGD